MSTRIGVSLTIKILPRIVQEVQRVEGKVGVCQAYLAERKTAKKVVKFLDAELKDSPHITKKRLKELEQEELSKEYSLGNSDEARYNHDFPPK